MTETVDCIVAGAGIVGLAIARALAMAGREVIVLERNAWIGNETSSRNNEVIHAGFLYTPDSLRAALCRRGAERTYDFRNSARDSANLTVFGPRKWRISGLCLSRTACSADLPP